MFVLPGCRNNESSVSLRLYDNQTPASNALLSLLGRLRLVAVSAAVMVLAAPSTGAAGLEPSLSPAPPDPGWQVPPFWQRLADCETLGRWDWGQYANTPDERRLEGTRFEGGLGFAATTWKVWAKAIGVVDLYAHAWMAPPRVQVRVAAYGLRHGGSWGCLH